MYSNRYDIVLVGGGIMSATLLALLHELDSSLQIAVFEKLDSFGQESSQAMNNAGTGHSGLCELNYTPQRQDGSIDISKAIHIAESFSLSKQFWAYLTQQKYFSSPNDFINSVAHCSFVTGRENVAYLKNRYDALCSHFLFKHMEYSEEKMVLEKWMPLVMKNRDDSIPYAATYATSGTDVDFGKLTNAIFSHTAKHKNIHLFTEHEVTNIDRSSDIDRTLHITDTKTLQKKNIAASFVFIGAGGSALSLLQKSEIPQGQGFGGFPVSGQWLVCSNPEIIEQHNAKVYGLAEVGSPPMSVPHLDTRIVDGKKQLLFGPFAGFTTKFLKAGSLWDLFLSIRWNNIVSMLQAGWRNLGLTKYLVKQALQSSDTRITALRTYFPGASNADWTLLEAGKRVQIIKNDKKKGGILQFGTELVCSDNGTLAALLGASPGASTAVSIMLELIEKWFPQHIHTDWKDKVSVMVPSYYQGTTSLENIEKQANEVLGLNS